MRSALGTAPADGSCKNVVERRFTPAGMERFFGKPTKMGTYSLADKLIEASGGHFRDLILLLNEAVLRVNEPPVTVEDVDAVISNLRTSYRPKDLVDARLLHPIAQTRACIPDGLDANTLQRITNFLDTHCALILRNGEEWYDIHPLIRDDVEEILKRDAARKKRDAESL